MTATVPALTRAERLDRLPFTREHGRLVVGSGLGWALDAMDVGLISFVMAALAAQWGLSPTQLSWIASIGFVGMALGATLGGLLADRFGRRQVFALTLLIFGVATGAAALAWSVLSLIVFRFSSDWGWAPSCRWPRPWSASSPRPGCAAGSSSRWRRSGRSAGRSPR